jgi:hypothetical protein
VRTVYPPEVRIGVVLDNYSPHLSTRDDSRVGDWAKANNVELAYVPTNASWLNRIESQFAGLRSSQGRRAGRRVRLSSPAWIDRADRQMIRRTRGGIRTLWR